MEAHLLQVNISNLRRASEPDPCRPSHVITEVAAGYRLKAEWRTASPWET